MSDAELPVISQPDPEDPLELGLASIPEELQRWWLIGAGNPCFDAELRTCRPTLGVPEAGFTNVADFVRWVVLKWSKHGHDTELERAIVWPNVGSSHIQSHPTRAFHIPPTGHPHRFKL